MDKECLYGECMLSECMLSECMLSECMLSECMLSECTICLLQYTEETKKATECHHIFHQECIDRWLENNNNCPLCRTCLQQHTMSNTDEAIPNTTYGEFLGFDRDYRFGSSAIMQLIAYGASDIMIHPPAPRSEQREQQHQSRREQQQHQSRRNQIKYNNKQNKRR